MEAMAQNPNSRLSSIPLRHPPLVIPSSSSSKTPPQQSQQPTIPQKPPKQFPSYLEALDLSPRARILCQIIANSTPQDVEAKLESTGFHIASDVVEEVLKVSYGHPLVAVKFFRWAGLKQKHSAFSWNLIVDLLGKNEMFEPMWDAIRSMKQEGVLAVTTFIVVFGSYCVVGRFNEAIMSFDVMERYGIQPDVLALNSLLSAICREDNQTSKAVEFFERSKTKVAPDGDSFAILLEGWEKEGNISKAKTTFGEMVIRVGWSSQNMAAYDAFLNTLVRGSQTDEAIKFLQVMKGKNCFPGLKFFSNAFDILVKQNDATHAVPLWEIMVGGGLVPNLITYNAMIGVLCSNNFVDNAFRLLDEMPFNGAFADSLTYNIIFQCLIKHKKVNEAGNFFFEMIKNECPPTHLNCVAAISLFFDGYDPEMAVKVWEYMVKNHVSPLDESANALLVGLCNMGRFSELRTFAEEMLEIGIPIYESTMGKFKSATYKAGRSALSVYDDLSRKLRSS